MYEQYWNLQRKPFENSTTSGSYYPSEIHQGALLKLRYTVEQHRGAAVLSGSEGVGKSLIVNSLFSQLTDAYHPRVHIVFPQMPADQMMAFLASEITGNPQTPVTVSESIRSLRDALAENAAAGKHAIVAIDEAHLIDDGDTLEALRLLLNFETDGIPHLTLLLVGQPQLLANLERSALGQRVDVRCLMRPYHREETASYISHRLTAAGAERTIFESAAMDLIHDMTQGSPRRINRVCDLALLIGYAEQRPSLAPEDIESVWDELVAISPE